MLTYKFRLYPNRIQERLLNDTLETCRCLYNQMYEDRIKNHVSYYEQKRRLVELKKENRYLSRVYSQVLQDVVLRLDKAFQSYFAGLSRFPEPKGKNGYNSFTYPQNIGFKIIGNRIKLGCIGFIKVKMHRPIEGEVKTATILRDVDQWFVCLTVEEKQRESVQESSLVITSPLSRSVSNGLLVQQPTLSSNARDAMMISTSNLF